MPYQASNTTGLRTKENMENSALTPPSVRLAGSNFEPPGSIVRGVQDYPGGATHEYLTDEYRPSSTFGHHGAAPILGLPAADGATSSFVVQQSSNSTAQLRRYSSLSLVEGSLSAPNTSGGPLYAHSFDIAPSIAYAPFNSTYPESNTSFPNYEHSFHHHHHHFHDHERHLQTCGMNPGPHLHSMDESGHLDTVPESDTTSSGSLPPYSALSSNSTTEQSMTATPPTPITNATLRHHREPQNPGREQPLPFNVTKMDQDVMCEGNKVQINIDAKCPKNVFNVEGIWTCYRRNYIAVESSFSLSHTIPNASLYLPINGRDPRKIQAFAIKLDAKCDGADGKEIELVQHTAKRDKGEKTLVEMKKLAPSLRGCADSNFIASMSPPHLPLQGDEDSAESNHTPTRPAAAVSSSSQMQHTFERIQFKTATANNGRRRAQQQYYYLVVSLWADVRALAQCNPEWVKVAHRVSEPMVVRGRSPGHYTDSRSSQDQNGSFGGGGGAGTSGGRSRNHTVSRSGRSRAKTSRRTNTANTTFSNMVGHRSFSYQPYTECLRLDKDRYMDGLEPNISPLFDLQQAEGTEFWGGGPMRMDSENSPSWFTNISIPTCRLNTGGTVVKLEPEEIHGNDCNRDVDSISTCIDGSWLPGRYTRLTGSKRSRSRSKDVLESIRLCFKSPMV